MLWICIWMYRSPAFRSIRCASLSGESAGALLSKLVEARQQRRSAFVATNHSRTVTEQLRISRKCRDSGRQTPGKRRTARQLPARVPSAVMRRACGLAGRLGTIGPLGGAATFHFAQFRWRLERVDKTYLESFSARTRAAPGDAAF